MRPSTPGKLGRAPPLAGSRAPASGSAATAGTPAGSLRALAVPEAGLAV